MDAIISQALGPSDIPSGNPGRQAGKTALLLALVIAKTNNRILQDMDKGE
jgi:hypothetical protein